MVLAAIILLWPFHVICIGLLALLCQDVFAKKRPTIRSLFALTTVVGLEMTLVRLVIVLTDNLPQ